MPGPGPRPVSPRPSGGGSVVRPGTASDTWSGPRSLSPVRPSTPIRPATHNLIPPLPMPRCMVQPTPEYWRHRDIQAEIQRMARMGMVPVKPVGDDVSEFTGFSYYPAGWIAYGFRVPPKGKLHVRLHHPNEGWFRLLMVNKWSRLEEGMLQNMIPTGNPEVTYTNPTKEARSVYVIVDDPGWMSTPGNLFKINVDRSWDPSKVKIDHAPIVTGIWAENKEEAKPAPGAKDAPAPTKG